MFLLNKEEFDRLRNAGYGAGCTAAEMLPLAAARRMSPAPANPRRVPRADMGHASQPGSIAAMRSVMLEPVGIVRRVPGEGWWLRSPGAIDSRDRRRR